MAAQVFETGDLAFFLVKKNVYADAENFTLCKLNLPLFLRF